MKLRLFDFSKEKLKMIEIKRNIFFECYLAIFQVVFIVLSGIFASYDNNGQKEIPQIFSSNIFRE